MTFKQGYHYDKDLENAIIGAILLEPDVVSRIQGLIEPNHFHHADNEACYQTILEMWEDGLKIDLLSLVHEIHSRGRADKFNNLAYEVTVKTNLVASTANIEQHALFVRQMAARRKRIEVQAMADSNVEDDVTKLQDIVDELNAIITVDATDDWHDMSQVMLSVSKHMDEVRGKDMLGIHTGFSQLDRWTMGWQPGQMIVVGARPSVGKSAFVSGLALKAAQEGKVVGIINLEMPEEQVGARLASFYSDTEFWRIYTAHMGEEQEAKVSAQMAELATYSIYVSDKTNVTIADIRSKAMRLKKRAGLNMLILDYLQLVESNGNKRDTREREVAKMARGLKLMAKELGIPVIALCQLNRDSEKSADKKPRMSNLRESGALEQDADIVLLLHRAWKAGIEADTEGNSTERKGTIIVEKNRNGAIGEIDVDFEPETMKWKDPEKTLWTPAPAVQGYRDYTQPKSEETPF